MYSLNRPNPVEGSKPESPLILSGRLLRPCVNPILGVFKVRVSKPAQPCLHACPAAKLTRYVT